MQHQVAHEGKDTQKVENSLPLHLISVKKAEAQSLLLMSVWAPRSTRASQATEN